MNKNKKIWLSDGREQLELEKLIRSGAIGSDDKPSDIQNKYAHLFNGFLPNVFRSHLSSTRRNMG